MLFFLLGTVTYAVRSMHVLPSPKRSLTMVQVFDPIRVVMVEGKINDWFDYKRKWLSMYIPAQSLNGSS